MIGFGIDIGVGSIGLTVIERDENDNPIRLIDGATRIFPSSAGSMERRQFRSGRTQNQRRSARLSHLSNTLEALLGVDCGNDEGCADLLHDGLKTTQRSHLRALGLSQALTSGDLGRVILSLAKNRGVRLTRGLNSNDKEEEKDREKVKGGAVNTRITLNELGKSLNLQQPATPGQLLYERMKNGVSTRLKKDVQDSPTFTRLQVIDETERLLVFQAQIHPSLADDQIRRQLIDQIFWEAESPPPVIGQCTYRKTGEDGKIEKRVRKASDLFQTKRIYEEVNNLRLRDRLTAETRVLTLDERNRVTECLLDGADISPAKLRQILGLGKGATAPLTSLEEQKGSKGRKQAGKLLAHPLAKAMKRIKRLDIWTTMSTSDKDELFAKLAEEDDSEELSRWLLDAHGIKPEEAEILSRVSLPSSRAASGPTATRLLLEELQQDVISLYEAEQRAGLTRTDLMPKETLPRLPYYGELFTDSCVGGTGHPADPPEKRYGKIPNPVVHTALNTLRTLVNEFIKRHCRPEWVNLELARDLHKSAEASEEIERQSASKRKKNDSYAVKIRGQGARVGKRNLRKMQLHEWQEQRCLYTGQTIPLSVLFTEAVEIDHILPRKETMDDGAGNLGLVYAQANQFKAKRAPYQAFSQGYAGRSYSEILKDVEANRPGSHWRFEPDALDRFKGRNGMQARFLGDTRYIAKVASAYLAYLLKDKSAITTINGPMTALMRHLWGLDDVITDMMVDDGVLDPSYLAATKLDTDKERQERVEKRRKLRYDHRHHILDALIVGCCTRSDIQRIQTLAARVDGYGDLLDHLKDAKDRGDRIFRETGMPWQEDFRSVVKNFLAVSQNDPALGKRVRVTHKPDHNPMGELHGGTNYRFICLVPGKTDQYVCASRQQLTALKSAKAVESIRVGTTISRAIQGATDAKMDFSWGQPDTMRAVEELNHHHNRIADRILELVVEAPDPEGTTSETKKEEDRVTWAIDKFIKETGQKRYQRFEIKTLRVVKGPVPGGNRPLMLVATKNNDRLIHWLDKDGGTHWDVVTTLDAARTTFLEPWEDAGGRLLFRLRQNDIVEMENHPDDPSGGRDYFRLASISPGDFEFVRLSDARPSKDGRGVFSRRLRSDKALEGARIRHCIFSPGGQLLWQSRSRN